ncbi:MAG: AAA family ATPase [Candidatus Riflebacteria bacterium]|nr:AAA family ATPase [Candidatus Riflebacteria bacterium]
MNQIRNLTIRGFKSIKSLESFNLYDLNVLIGANGAGKSNFVSFFRMLNEMVEQRLQVWTQKQGGADRILSFGIKETQQFSAGIRFGLNEYDIILEPTAEGGFIFSREQLYFSGPHFGITRPSLGSGHKESNLKKEMKGGVSANVASYCFNSISAWKVFHVHDTSETAGVKRQGSTHDYAYLRSDASNLAPFLFQLSKNFPETYQQIRKTISLAVPFFDDFIWKPQKLSSDSDEEQVRLLWRQQGSDYPLWPSQLSDGTIRFICLVTALLQPQPPSTIIIDEPELGLHPYAITLLGALIRSASKRMQIIVSTQSVPLLNEFSIEDLVVVERKEGGTIFNRLSQDEFKTWLEDYSVGELWEKNILGGRPEK